MTAVLFAGMVLGGWLALVGIDRAGLAPVQLEGRGMAYLDGMRGLAAASVLLIHIANVPNTAGVDMLPGYFQFSWGPFTGAGGAGVETFFVLTAFLFWSKIRRDGYRIDTQSFFRARLFRIVPMYLAVTTAIVFAYFACTSFVPRVPVETLLTQVLIQYSFGLAYTSEFNGWHTLSLNAVNWTLGLEWKFYVFLPLFVFLLSNLRRASAMVGMVLAVGVLYLLLGHALYDWCYFLAGIAIAEVSARIGSRVRANRWIRWALAAAGLGAVTGLVQLPGDHGNPVRVALMAALFGSVALLEPSFLGVAPLRRLGNVSYSLYLVHLPVFQAVFHLALWLAKDAVRGPWGYIVFSAVAAFASIVVSGLTFKWVEAPWIRRGKLSEPARPLPIQVQLMPAPSAAANG